MKITRPLWVALYYPAIQMFGSRGGPGRVVAGQPAGCLPAAVGGERFLQVGQFLRQRTWAGLKQRCFWSSSATKSQTNAAVPPRSPKSVIKMRIFEVHLVLWGI